MFAELYKSEQVYYSLPTCSEGEEWNVSTSRRVTHRRSLYILTGQAGAGKSHLAAAARRAGTLWVLDTEGAAQNLSDKPGIHRRIQVMQSLSLRALTAAMEEIRTNGKPGDTVVLDSISKVLQAMRAYAQRRAGAETDRKTGIAYDEHASVNRNMQAVYTGLTELKHAGSCHHHRTSGAQVSRARRRRVTG